ncbi:MAG TPA: aminoglycoside phosphotransferase, partial [Paracoccaceae bacterium]|nr:aminoglycoside phosphotransferase [Paracoccaceae bacterium]
LGAQRNLKIIGIFARLARRDGKARYLSLIPRVWGHLQRDLSHPALARLADWVGRNAPAPEPAVLARAGAGVPA